VFDKMDDDEEFTVYCRNCEKERTHTYDRNFSVGVCTSCSNSTYVEENE